MKKLGFIILFFTVISCGSYNSIDNFYNEHKNDTNVTAIRVPHFMLSLLRNSSPEMNNFLGTVRDIRYIQLSPQNETQSTLIGSQINNLTTNRFIEVFRKNEDTKRTLISVRENRDVVKEILIYKNSSKSNSVFYLNGNFDPNKVRKYAKEGTFDKLTNSLLQQYNMPSIITN